MLARTGLRRLEVTSFVRPDVIPQLADAEEVLASIERVDGRRLLGPDPERARARARARPARSLRRGQPLPLRVGDPQPRNVNRSIARVARRARAGDRARPRRGPSLRGRDLGQLRLSLRGRGAAPSASSRSPSALAAAGCEEIAFGDTTGMANPRQVGEFFAAARERLPEVELTAHFHNTRGQGLANVHAALERRDRLVRVGLRRARRLPGAPGLDRQHLDRGPGLDAARRWGSRPGSTCRS